MKLTSLRPTDDVALLHTDGSSVSYRELVRLADQACRQLPRRGKGLIALFGDRELGTLVTYLAALRHGHAVGWFGSVTDVRRRTDLMARFRPDVIVAPSGQLAQIVRGYACRPGGPAFLGVETAVRTGAPGSRVHDDTDVLLLTSGSMSPGRAVRLSAASVAANSRAVGDALHILPGGRAVTSLPLFYAYGLSVLNSHITAGASMLLTDAPATGRRFWHSFAAAECTTFAATPFHLDWLARSRLPWNSITSLRSVTVSGARTATSLAHLIHQLAERSGFQFYKMYGLSEATARISVLAHEDFPRYPDSVGRVIRGSSVTIQDDAGLPVGDGRPGHILYHGPNAMQGYADSAEHLRAPDQMQGTVDTGDLGFMVGGFLHVTGRAGRFVKPGGKRLELDPLEALFADLAPAAVVGSDDERAHVFIEGEPSSSVQDLKREITRLNRVSPDDLQIHFTAALPRMPNGKTDYRALAWLISGRG